ncbi:MAG: hypothetical protein OES20_08785 [Gammaproteobacteria bacterium]|nr:hypothetical protein [Gammaproteobacteria bacterium]MDH3859270.1 hypothetical protein [Gammaproteobacteria bacterium]
MELLLVSTCAAICIAIFAALRIPLNQFTVPATSIGGIVLVFALIQVLNYYHPYTGLSQQHLTTVPVTPDFNERVMDTSQSSAEPKLIAWFHRNSLLHLNQGRAAEVTFDSIPGKVFSGEVQMLLPMQGENQALTRDQNIDPVVAAGEIRIPVVISISDPRYENYATRIPGRSYAQAAVYGEEFQQLALVRKTLLRMSAWMNYLSPIS